MFIRFNFRDKRRAWIRACIFSDNLISSPEFLVNILLVIFLLNKYKSRGMKTLVATLVFKLMNVLSPIFLVNK